MADQPQDEPSLEMPTISLRRKKGRTPDPEGVTPPAPTPRPEPAAQPTPTTTLPDAEPEPEPAPAPRAPRVSLPALPPLAAVTITGAVVGGLAVLLTWLSTTACDAVRGTPSCGGGPGFLILVAVLVVLAYAGALLLGALGVPDAGSTSVLAVGITAVLVMLFLLDSIYDGWMVIAIPVVAVIAFAASWWITHAVVEGQGD